ncbi:MAG: cytochrome P460 family protein [bacterium]
MGKKSAFLIVFALTLGFSIAALALHEIVPSETQAVLPGANAEKLNEYIVRFDPYRAWPLFPGKERLSKGAEPHGVLVTTLLNDTALSSIKKKEAADGSIIVLENYTADKKFTGLSVMYKIKGYNPAGGDWFWVQYAPDGKAETWGRVKECIDCHGKMKESDYLFDVKKEK